MRGRFPDGQPVDGHVREKAVREPEERQAEDERGEDGPVEDIYEFKGGIQEFTEQAIAFGQAIEGIRNDLLRHLEDQPANSYLFVAEDEDGERAGFIHLQRTADFFTGRSNCHISDIAVAPQHEGRGVGKALLAHAETWAREHQCQLVTLAVFPGNERARALYEASGYAPDLLRLAKPVR